MGCRKRSCQGGIISAKGEVRWKFVTNTTPASENRVASEMYMCMDLLVKNQCMNVPSGGIIEGYFLVFCMACSSAESWGPG